MLLATERQVVWCEGVRMRWLYTLVANLDGA